MEINHVLTYVDCEILWKQLKEKLRELNADLLPEQLVEKRNEAKTLFQQYRDCMMVARPGFVQRQLRVDESALIFGDDANHHEEPQNGGKRRRKSRRSKHSQKRHSRRRFRTRRI